jgi:hypothetical protein
MTQSNRDIQMAPRQRPMPHEGPPTARDRTSLYLYVGLALFILAGFIIAGFFV